MTGGDIYAPKCSPNDFKIKMWSPKVEISLLTTFYGLSGVVLFTSPEGAVGIAVHRA